MLTDLLEPDVLYSKIFNENVRMPGVDEDIKINIPLPKIPILNEILIKEIKKYGPSNSIYNLPIFIIQSHGDLRTSISIKSNTNDLKSISIPRDNLFKKTNVGEWVIYNTPPSMLGVANNKDNIFVKNINKNLSFFKKQLFSNEPSKIFNLINNSGQKNNNGCFCPPLNIYADKSHYFYDDPGEGEIFNWTVGVLPIFTSNKNNGSGLKESTIPNFFYKNENFKNENNIHLQSRVFNCDVINKINWSSAPKACGTKILKKIHNWWPDIPKEWYNRNPTLLERYSYLTDVIMTSLPISEIDQMGNYINTFRKETSDCSGKYILLSEIMYILGKGVYISLACSSLNNNRSLITNNINPYNNYSLNEKINYRVLNNITNIINQNSLTNWKYIFPLKKKYNLREKKINTLVIDYDIDLCNNYYPGPIGFRNSSIKKY
jgi:hypothetical protein